MTLNAKNALSFLPKGIGENGALAQIGIDLSVENITEIVGGELTIKGKYILPYKELKTLHRGNDIAWQLEAGKVYSLTFQQEIKLDSKHYAEVVGKSTTNRIACLIRSGIYDPGFESVMGATMYCFSDKVCIERGAKLAQLVVKECQESELYDGSYQKNKDLK